MKIQKQPGCLVINDVDRRLPKKDIKKYAGLVLGTPQIKIIGEQELAIKTLKKLLQDKKIQKIPLNQRKVF